MDPDDSRVARPLALLRAAMSPPRGRGRVVLALAMGSACHVVFAVAIASMIGMMYFGLTKSVGRVDWPLALFVNTLLIVQFPLAHSWLLTRRGLRVVSALVPGPHGATLGTTSYALIASFQLLALFWLWTPSGIVWWEAEGFARVVATVLYAGAWLVLGKAIFDAGMELQSGALGWLSLLARVRPKFPDMPTLGLFRVIRQPIYVAFACTLWTVPTWTPDQLALAIAWTAYCIGAPRLKERRFAAQFGPRFEAYRREVPYMVPCRRRRPD